MNPKALVLLITSGLVLAPDVTARARADDEEPTASAVGAIAFASLAPRGWDVYALEPATGREHRLTDHPRLDFNAAPAPDGRHVAFVSERGGNQDIALLEPRSGAVELLTDAFALDDHPAWSPDGRMLAFSSTREPGDEPGRAWNAIYVMDLEARSVPPVSPPGVADYSPAWSPRGDLIAVASGDGRVGGTDVFVMAPDGSDRRLVVEDAGWPGFSADGSALFVHRREGGWGIWRVGLDGSAPERITPPDVEAYTPRASADGTAGSPPSNATGTGRWPGSTSTRGRSPS